MIKTPLASIAVCLACSTAMAGGLGEPVMEPVIIETETEAASSSGYGYVPRIIFTLFVLVAANS